MACVYTSPRWFLAQAGSQGWLWPRLDLAQAIFWHRLVRKAGFGSGWIWLRLVSGRSQGWLWPRLDLAQAGFGSGWFLARAGLGWLWPRLILVRCSF